LDPINVNVERMLGVFRAGCRELGEIWALALEPSTLKALRGLVERCTTSEGPFHLDDELWTQIVYDFACAHNRRRLERGHLLRSLTPLYLARVASFVIETREMFAPEVEDRIEHLCQTFENLKPYLETRWRSGPVHAPPGDSVRQTAPGPQTADKLEVKL
jgi:hypothetical protein